MNAAVTRVKQALEPNNHAEIQSATDELAQVWHEGFAQMHQQKTAAAPGIAVGDPSAKCNNNIRTYAASIIGIGVYVDIIA